MGESKEPTSRAKIYVSAEIKGVAMDEIKKYVEEAERISQLHPGVEIEIELHDGY